jgi:aminocarboxymuconate-semialdehyde decarboxylase
VKIVGSHLGGGICDVIGRLDYAYELLDFSAFLGPYAPMLIKHPPRHYLKMFYLDSACYWAPAAECALKSVGEDHFLFGTDSPPMVPLKQKGFDLMSNIGMSKTQYDKVMGGNAARLLKLN